jgi:hypothetical protein
MRALLIGVLVAALAACGGESSPAADVAADLGAPDAAPDVAPDVPSDVVDMPDAPDVPSDVVDMPDAPDVPDAPSVVYGTPCESATQIGEFQVAHEDFYAQVSGAVAEGVIPLTVLQEVESEGDCRLLQKKNPFCDPGCGAGALCDHDATCIPYPENKSVGAVTVSGLTDGELVMEPKNATYFDTNVALPLFGPGDPISLSAAGDELPGFELAAYGVPDLELASDVLTMVESQPLELTWTGAEGAWRVYFSLNIDQHGSSPATLFCDVEDTGAFQVPAHFVDSILAMGVSGFATAHFYRRTVDSAQLDAGCVQLTVSSYVYGKLEVEGHSACNSDPDCPDGEVCDIAINTCVEGG